MSLHKIQKGLFIVIEGIDGSGKETQAKRLCAFLEQQQIPYKTMDFPAYRSWSSILVRLYLKKRVFGDPDKLSPYMATIFYALDRFVWSFKIRSWLKKGLTVICDRYVSSNKGHQAGKITDTIKRKKVLNWIDLLEYKILRLPQPDYVIYLSVTPTAALKLLKKTGKIPDGHEGNKDHLIRSHQCYTWLTENNSNWIGIDCMKADKSAILSIDEIANLVRNQIINKLNYKGETNE